MGGLEGGVGVAIEMGEMFGDWGIGYGSIEGRGAGRRNVRTGD